MRLSVYLVEYNRTVTVEKWGDRIRGQGHDPDRLLATLETIDPTPTHSYVPWLVQQVLAGIPVTDLDASVLDQFHRAKVSKRFSGPDADIQRWTFPRLQAHMATLSPTLTKQQRRGTYTRVYTDATIDIYQPHDMDAACWLGKHTKWCTAATKSDNHFPQYHSDALYILIPKHPHSTADKYQLYVPNAFQFQLADASNQQIVGMDLRVRFSEAFRFVLTRHPEMRKVLTVATEPELMRILQRANAQLKPWWATYRTSRPRGGPDVPSAMRTLLTTTDVPFLIQQMTALLQIPGVDPVHFHVGMLGPGYYVPRLRQLVASPDADDVIDALEDMDITDS